MEIHKPTPPCGTPCSFSSTRTLHLIYTSIRKRNCICQTVRKCTNLNQKVTLSHLIFYVRFTFSNSITYTLKTKKPEFTFDTFTVFNNNMCFANYK